MAPTPEGYFGYGGRRLLSPLSRTGLKGSRLSARRERILEPLRHPVALPLPPGPPVYLQFRRPDSSVSYLPAESNTGMFGGNSNWRGPIWMPINALIVRGLLHLYTFYGDDLKVECPTGSGQRMTLFEVAHEISRRLSGIFLRDEPGRRPVYGGSKSSRRTRTGATRSSSMSTSMGTMAPVSGPAIRRAGRGSWPASWICSAARTRPMCSSWRKRRLGKKASSWGGSGAIIPAWPSSSRDSWPARGAACARRVAHRYRSRTRSERSGAASVAVGR